MTTFLELRVGPERRRTWAGRPQAVPRRPILIHMPCPCRQPAVLSRGLEKPLPERHGPSTVGARDDHGMVCVNQTRLHCVNQMGDKLNPKQHGMGRVCCVN